MAMTDYPYASAFLEPMPAWPINVSCQAFKDIAPQEPEPYNKETGLTDRQKLVLTALNTSASVYFNYENQTSCTNTSDTEGTGTLAAGGWDVLACNELPMPTSFSKDSMFIEYAFDYTAYTTHCQTTFGLTPQYDWALTNFGGYNITQDFKSYSRIYFSNGELDPWMAGGVTEFISIKLPFGVIKGGAHHLDLRLPNVADGDDVVWVRQQETEVIESWIKAYQPD